MCSEDQKAQRVAVMEQDRSPLFRCDFVLTVHMCTVHIHTTDTNRLVLLTASKPHHMQAALLVSTSLWKVDFNSKFPSFSQKLTAL